MNTKRICGRLLLSAGLLMALTPVWAGVEQRLAAAQANRKVLDQAVDEGRKASFFCANCHGADGNSALGEVPNLAGQNPAYLLEQIRKFAQGQRRNEFMEKMIRVLSETEQVNIALFYSQQKVAPRPVTEPALLAKGADWFMRVCQRCHGEQGLGNERTARIAGQQVSYLVQTLTRYRDRTGERLDPLMATNTAFLKNDDIRAIAEFVAQMK